MELFEIPELIKRIAICNYLTIIKLRRVCKAFARYLANANITEKHEQYFEHGTVFYLTSYIIGTNIKHGACITLSSDVYWYEEFVFGKPHGREVFIGDDGLYVKIQYFKGQKCKEKRKFLF
jgi:hypothetical protein